VLAQGTEQKIKERREKTIVIARTLSPAAGGIEGDAAISRSEATSAV